jgi:hypothetical protein
MVSILVPITVIRQTTTNGLVSVVKAQNPGHTRISTSTLEPFGGYILVLSSLLFRYFLKFEKFVPSKAHPGVMAVEHGADGPIEGNNKYQRRDSLIHCLWCSWVPRQSFFRHPAVY